MKTVVFYFFLLLHFAKSYGQIDINKNMHIKVDFANKRSALFDDFKINQINTINDKLYVLGKFDFINSTPCKNAIVFDGQKWSPFLGDDLVE